MKKIVILIALVVISTTAMSQTQYGIRAGMTLSTYHSAQSIYQFKPGIHVGGVADIPIGSSKFSFMPGIYFADKGTKTKGSFPLTPVNSFVPLDEYTFEGTHHNYQLEIPLLFTYRIPVNENFTLKPQIGAFVSYTVFGRINEDRKYVSMVTAPPEFPMYYYFHDGNYWGFGGNAGLSALYNRYSFTVSCDVGHNNRPNTQSNFLYYDSRNPDICVLFSFGYDF